MDVLCECCFLSLLEGSRLVLFEDGVRDTFKLCLRSREGLLAGNGKSTPDSPLRGWSVMSLVLILPKSLEPSKRDRRGIPSYLSLPQEYGGN